MGTTTFRVVRGRMVHTSARRIQVCGYRIFERTYQTFANTPVLRCSMQSFPLNAVPAHEALSYRWGFGSDGSKLQYRTILVDGKTLRVPKSAWELLHARSSMSNDRLVWTVAICINQKNQVEKTGQIPLMDQIYTKAHQTIVWPGDRFDSGMASRMLLRLYVTNYVFQAKDEEFLLFFEYEIVRRGWRAMIGLFENAYFTRMW